MFPPLLLQPLFCFSLFTKERKKNSAVREKVVNNNERRNNTSEVSKGDRLKGTAMKERMRRKERSARSQRRECRTTRRDKK